MTSNTLILQPRIEQQDSRNVICWYLERSMDWKRFAQLLWNEYLKIQPTVLFLEGELGAGKTTFVRYLIQEISSLQGRIDETVVSPTYSIHQRYEWKSPLPIVMDHLDLYRIKEKEELDSFGFWELFENDDLSGSSSKCVRCILIEWPKNWIRPMEIPKSFFVHRLFIQNS